MTKILLKICGKLKNSLKNSLWIVVFLAGVNPVWGVPIGTFDFTDNSFLGFGYNFSATNLTGTPGAYGFTVSFENLRIELIGSDLNLVDPAGTDYSADAGGESAHFALETLSGGGESISSVLDFSGVAIYSANLVFDFNPGMQGQVGPTLIENSFGLVPDQTLLLDFSPSSPSTSVPEPATFFLLVTGLAVAGAYPIIRKSRHLF